MKLDCCSGITLASRCDSQVAPSATLFLVTDTVAEFVSSPGLPIDHGEPSDSSFYGNAVLHVGQLT